MLDKISKSDYFLRIKNAWVLLFLIAAIVLGCLLIGHTISIGEDYVVVGTVAMAWFGGASIVFTAITLYMMQNADRPLIFVEFRSDENQKQLALISVKNIGSALAKNVSIDVIPPEIEKDLIKCEKIIGGPTKDRYLFSNVIPVLPPGKEQTEIFSTWNRLAPHKEELKYTFEVKYSSPSGKHYSEPYDINITYMFGEGIAEDVEVRALTEIKKSIDTLEGHVKGIEECYKQMIRDKDFPEK